MAIDVPLNSRYRTTDVVVHNGQEVLGLWPGFSWIDSEPWRIITVGAEYSGRLDLLSYQHYGTPDYWWVIMYYNHITNINWPRAGDVVRLPSPTLILGT